MIFYYLFAIMKHVKHTFLFISISILSFFASCSKEDKAPSTSGIIKEGKWKIISFTDNGANETNNYAGYEFTFSPNGTVTAVKNGISANGTWSTGADENTNQLQLIFGLAALSELNENWSFTEKSYSLLKLEYVAPNNGGTDVLILEKI
jgi:hypothetical protein